MRFSRMVVGLLFLATSVCLAQHPTGHPRIFFGATDIPVIKSRAITSGDAQLLFSQVLVPQAAYFSTNDLPSVGGDPAHQKDAYYEDILSLAFCYIASNSGNANYLAAAIDKVFNATNGIIYDAAAGGRPIDRRIITLALVYDWLYDSLSTSRRTQIQQCIISDINYTNPNQNSQASSGPRDFFSLPNIALQGNWIDHPSEALIMGAIAIYGENPNYSTAQADADIALAAGWAFQGNNSWLNRLFSPEDGAYSEGVSYELWEGSRLIPMLEALGRWNAIDYFQTTQVHDRLSRLYDWLAYEVRPLPTLLNNVNRINDSYSYHTGAMATALSLSVHYPEKAGLMRWVFEQTDGTIHNLLPDSSSFNYEQTALGNPLNVVIPFLAYNHVAAVQPSTVLPMSKYFRQSGLSYIRTSATWADNNDIQFSFHCQSAFDPLTGKFSIRHDHPDVNSITLSAFGHEFITAQGYDNKFPQASNYVMIYNPSVNPPVYQGVASGSTWNSSGQEIEDWLERPARFVAHNISGHFDFIHGDAYDSFRELFGESNGVVQTFSDPNNPEFNPSTHNPAWSYLNPVRNADRYIVSHRASTGTRHFFVVADDINKDGTPHTYQWVFNTEPGLTVSGTNPITISADTAGSVKLWYVTARSLSEY